MLTRGHHAADAGGGAVGCLPWVTTRFCNGRKGSMDQRDIDRWRFDSAEHSAIGDLG